MADDSDTVTEWEIVDWQNGPISYAKEEDDDPGVLECGQGTSGNWHLRFREGGITTPLRNLPSQPHTTRAAAVEAARTYIRALRTNHT